MRSSIAVVASLFICIVHFKKLELAPTQIGFPGKDIAKHRKKKIIPQAESAHNNGKAEIVKKYSAADQQLSISLYRADRFDNRV